jgi:hypothetical protein
MVMSEKEEKFNNKKAFSDLCKEYRSMDRIVVEDYDDLTIFKAQQELKKLEIDRIVRAEKLARKMPIQSEKSRENATKWKWQGFDKEEISEEILRVEDKKERKSPVFFIGNKMID